MSIFNAFFKRKEEGKKHSTSEDRFPTAHWQTFLTSINNFLAGKHGSVMNIIILLSRGVT